MSAERVAVVGLGLLGRGIAACFVGRGFSVLAIEKDDATHAEARREIAAMMDELVEFGGFNPALRDEWAARYVPATDFAGLGDCTFVVESVSEDEAVKDTVFDAIEAVVPPSVVIASNTSSIPISRLQEKRKHPGRFVGMHWAEPAHATRFMELIRGEQTSDEALETTAQLAKRLGKDPAVCGQDLPAFIVNRIGYAMYREALHLLESGVADADTIDRAMRNSFGLWATVCGPFRWIDITGGPALYAKAMARVLPTLSKADEVEPLMRDLEEKGARGSADGQGFFEYTPDEAKRWQELYRRHAWRVSRMHNEYFPLNTEAQP